MGPIRVCYRRGRGGPSRLKGRGYHEFAKLDSSAFGHRVVCGVRMVGKKRKVERVGGENKGRVQERLAMPLYCEHVCDKINAFRGEGFGAP